MENEIYRRSAYRLSDSVRYYLLFPALVWTLGGMAGFLAVDFPRDIYTLIKNKGEIVRSVESPVPDTRKIVGISGLEIPLEQIGAIWGAGLGGLAGILISRREKQI